MSWSWWIMQFLEKTMENAIKHRNIKLVTTERRKNCLVSEPHYHTTKSFMEHLLAIQMKKMLILMNKPVYLGLSILEFKENINVWVLVWLCKTKIWWKSKIVLYR